MKEKSLSLNKFVFGFSTKKIDLGDRFSKTPLPNSSGSVVLYYKYLHTTCNGPVSRKQRDNTHSHKQLKSTCISQYAYCPLSMRPKLINLIKYSKEKQTLLHSNTDTGNVSSPMPLISLISLTFYAEFV